MSFITKRERVFNEYDLFDIPARNEGKLKAYASCTDARAWSHFCSDKAEHLVEIIKRNNETVTPKYVPTSVIVDTLMGTKNAEIVRLKSKIEEFEQMLAAYDELDLTCEQKCEIAAAHAAIKAANKDLDEMFLDLDLSGFTEGIDSEAFETGKSRGDEPAKYKGDEVSFERKAAPQTETKMNQMGLECPCDASTSAHDTRIDEMQDAIIAKDAKMNAMQNTIAVMENDVCEPYCIYAHIYTALEKIFGTLSQNAKYKQYLDLLTSGKDTRCIDIKGRILYKLKVLEKFSLALIAPCSQDFNTASAQDCPCYRAEIVARVETTYALTSAEFQQPSLDNKRAQLVADIMENDEMKDILSKDSSSTKNDDDQMFDSFCTDNYSIDTENLKRLKNLQENYDDLMTCYESVKHEKECLQIRCQKYEELEKEYENLKSQLREYNTLWNEKEHYQRRSIDLDSLKEKYLILADETSNLETQLKAEAEINNIKSNTIDELRNENINLEKKLNETIIGFEKEKNNLECKLKETECKVMCQEQQIKSLSLQIDRLLEQDQDKFQSNETSSNLIALIDEIESLKDQIKNLKDALFCNEEEKQTLQNEFQDKLNLINDLRMEIEDWKSSYDKTLQRNKYLERYTEDFRDEVHKLIQENRTLAQDVEEKTLAVENSISIINNKSHEVNRLLDEIEQKESDNVDLIKRLSEVQEMYNKSMHLLENEKNEALTSLKLARNESQELLGKVKDYDELVQKQDDMSKIQAESYEDLKQMLLRTMEENKELQMNATNQEKNNSILIQEIQRLREANSNAIHDINELQDENSNYKSSLDLIKKESGILENKLAHLDNISSEFRILKETHEKLVIEKQRLERELRNKSLDLDNAEYSIQLTKRESSELTEKLKEMATYKDDLIKLSDAYQRTVNEKLLIQKDLKDKTKELDNLLLTLNSLQAQNEELLDKSEQITDLQKELAELRKAYNELLGEKNVLQKDFDNKTEEINNLYNTLENKIEENKELFDQIKTLEIHQLKTKENIKTLETENMSSKTSLHAVQKESAELINRLKYYETMEYEFNKMKKAHDTMKVEKARLEIELDAQLADLKRIEIENHELSSQSQNLLTHSEDLEKALINARTELTIKSDAPTDAYADIIKEIEIMKREKDQTQKKIRDLLDKLDESESIIYNQSEQILARDSKIAILENQVNELEAEVRMLHKNLEEILHTGEEIKDNSYQKIDLSLKKMEAHHSRATHNMKMELAQLQNENAQLEHQLSASKMKSDESLQDKHKYMSLINNLQYEKENIVTVIKQIELSSIGDSSLSPDHCSVEDVLSSLDRIRKCFDAKHSKSSSLEQTLLKMQTSSQLLLSKADEAKKIVEKEKQKIINEKEEAIRDRLITEKQLADLKLKLENQITHDKGVIKDLEAKMLNQKLIIDKINQSTQNYVSKLEKEMQSLQDMYQNSMAKISELQEKIENMSDEKNRNIEIIDKANLELEAKSKEVAILQKQIEEIKKIPRQSTGVQVSMLENYRNVELQTDKELFEDYSLRDVDLKEIEKVNEMNMIQIHKPPLEKKIKENQPKQKPHTLNEVQILTVNVEPTFDYVKSSYLNYKLQRLSPGRLEQYSISCPSVQDFDDLHTPPISDQSPDRVFERNGKPYVESKVQTPNLIDIYNRQSLHTNSGNEYLEHSTVPRLEQSGPRSRTKSSAFTGFGLTNESFESESNKNYLKSNVFTEASDNSTDKDLFVIYRDSESNYAHKTPEEKGPWVENGNSQIMVEAVTVFADKTRKRQNNEIKEVKNRHNEIDTFLLTKEEEHFRDDKNANKLDIELPRVENGSDSITSDADKKSLDSYTIAIYSIPKQMPTKPRNETRNVDRTNSQPSINILKERAGTSNMNTSALIEPQDESQHRLSRVGADFLLIKDGNDDKNTSSQGITKTKMQPTNFGLQYILETVQRETNPNLIKAYNAARSIRKSRSEERFHETHSLKDAESPPSPMSALKISSTEYKTVSTYSQSKMSDKSGSKTFAEQSVLVKLESSEEYETKIKNLSNALENIEKAYKKKIEAIKLQYDGHIKNIINDHNQGVQSIQGLHEETLQDVIKIHENEIENLRSMSIEAMRKADKLEKENRLLKTKIQDTCSKCLIDEEPVKMSLCEVKRRKRSRDTKLLTKTNVEAFNVKPKSRSQGPCTCSLDVNISDTIRNIFEQVDVEQRKLAEHTYLKYIANKISNNTVESLDAQELSFLHLKVCRTWKTKLSKEEALQKRIDNLESELMNKQRNAQQHIADLDHKVAVERRRLQEVREAVCRSTPVGSREPSPMPEDGAVPPTPPPTAAVADNNFICNMAACTYDIAERRSAGDLMCTLSSGGARSRRSKPESNRAVLAKLDIEERHERKLYSDEPPTRLRRCNDRQLHRAHKK